MKPLYQIYQEMPNRKDYQHWQNVTDNTLAMWQINKTILPIRIYKTLKVFVHQLWVEYFDPRYER